MEADLPAGGANQGAPPEVIGPYRLLEVLGEGGMGVVWLAEQTEPIRRQVALKVIKLGMDTREVVARFEIERQALAVMDHPNIARVFDAGATDAGRPFFVMELVQGLPLNEYCDTHRLSLTDRIRLFQAVCRGVQHAHQKGLIHRDLKPSNILVAEVDGQAHPKIIDFGIARATEEETSDGTRLTRQNHQIGTPAYMSPEQVFGDTPDIDTRSDIYALGVLLYELLVGELPFPRESYRGPALFAKLAEDAPRPSGRFSSLSTAAELARARNTDSQDLARTLKGDLDWIVLKAMARERELRYETVNALTMELERYLSNEPVRARPPSALYRTRKFVRRHRAATAFALLALFLGVGFVVAQTIQAERIRKARDLAEARRGQAEGLIDFMLGDLREKLEPIGRLDVLADVGDQALDYYAALPEEEFSDSDLLTRSRALYQIGEVRLNEGDAEAAVGPLQESHRLAEALWNRDPENPDRLYSLAQSHFWVGYAHWLVGDMDAAEQEFEDYLDSALGLVALDGESLEYRMELAYAHGNLGSLRESRGDLPGAVKEYLATLPIQENLVQAEPDNLDWRLELSETLNKLGVAERKLGNFDESLRAHERELALKEDLVSRDSRNAYYQYRLSTALDLTAEVQIITGNAGEAETSNRASLELMEDLVALDPINAEWQRSEAVSERKVGEILLRRGSVAEAEDRLHRASAQLEKLGEDGTTTLDWRKDLARVHACLAEARLKRGEPRKAMEEVGIGFGLLAEEGTVTEAMRDEVRANLHILEGRARASLGMNQDARDAWEQALYILDPLAGAAGGADYRIMKLEALLLLGRADDASRVLRELYRGGFREGRILADAEARGVAVPDES